MTKDDVLLGTFTNQKGVKIFARKGLKSFYKKSIEEISDFVDKF